MLGGKQKYVSYKTFVDLGTDDETQSFYSKGNIRSVIGSKSFKEVLTKQKKKLKTNVDLSQLLSERPAIDDIISAVANAYQVELCDIKKRKSGRQIANMPRKVALYLCQQYGDNLYLRNDGYLKVQE